MARAVKFALRGRLWPVTLEVSAFWLLDLVAGALRGTLEDGATLPAVTGALRACLADDGGACAGCAGFFCWLDDGALPSCP